MGGLSLGFDFRVALVLGLFAASSSSAQGPGHTPDTTRGTVKVSLPMAFESNHGQAGKEVDFVARGVGFIIVGVGFLVANLLLFKRRTAS